jgi:hypothetical protein
VTAQLEVPYTLPVIPPFTFKLPVKNTSPIFVAFVVIADIITSSLLPDFLKNTRPSGTFIANCPTPNDAVVGIEPVAKLRKCMILSAICYKYLGMYMFCSIYFIYYKPYLPFMAS